MDGSRSKIRNALTLVSWKRRSQGSAGIIQHYHLPDDFCNWDLPRFFALSLDANLTAQNLYSWEYLTEQKKPTKSLAIQIDDRSLNLVIPKYMCSQKDFTAVVIGELDMKLGFGNCLGNWSTISFKNKCRVSVFNTRKSHFKTE